MKIELKVEGIIRFKKIRKSFYFFFLSAAFDVSLTRRKNNRCCKNAKIRRHFLPVSSELFKFNRKWCKRRKRLGKVPTGKVHLLLGHGCNSMVEQMPHDPEVVGSFPNMCWAFFY